MADIAGTLRTGKLARLGLLDDAAQEDAAALLAAIGDLETVRVLFVDQHGILRGKTLVASALGSAFTSGIAAPSTLLLKDTSHRTVFPVWSPDAGIASGPMQGANDILLVPVPTTFRRLPWSPHSAWIFCDTVFRDGTAIPFSSRRVLQTAIDQLADEGMSATIGLEVEFHIFQLLDPALAHADTTMPARPPQTQALAQGYQFLTETRYGEVEEVLDQLRRAAQDLGLAVRSVEIEMGPSQFEFTFDPAGPMEQADALVMFRTMVKEVCARRGLHATFMPKPRVENAAASGWHIHQSVCDIKTGANLFMPNADQNLTSQASGWIAGLLAHASESCLLTSPTVNGYKRYQPFQLAPNRIVWGHDNRGAMVRGLFGYGDAASRVENRAPDTAANPYFALAAQLVSGLRGITAELNAPPPSADPYGDGSTALPSTLGQAIDAFAASPLYRETFGDECVDYLVRLKGAEWDRYLNAVSEWEQAEYFSLY